MAVRAMMERARKLDVTLSNDLSSIVPVLLNIVLIRALSAPLR